MKTVLVTGGSGFFGELLIERLVANNFFCVNIDLEKNYRLHPNLVSIQGDIRNTETLEVIFSKYKFDVIFHCAAILAHAVKDKKFLWTSNVNGTRNIAEFAKKYEVQKVIFTSSNCLWAENFHRPVKEEDAPKPAEIYGKSKWEGEKILLEYTDFFKVIIIRCPTIVDFGRLGLLAILFEFIDEGRKVWVIGGGDNRYQFIYAQDLIDACIKAIGYNKSDIFNIGSDNVKTFKELYNYVIQKANTGSKLASLPKSLAVAAMKIAYMFKISPFGPYQYKMLAEDFMFDTSKIKEKLNWRPTLTNEEMLYNAYQYYHENREEIRRRVNVSAHKQAARMGVIKLLKWLS
jgi:nucleoside-diphosphate-sugar epimerase